MVVMSQVVVIRRAWLLGGDRHKRQAGTPSRSQD